MSSGSTTTYQLPYPVQTDPVNVASDVEDLATAVETELLLKASLLSPEFTGTPLAPTAATDTSTTQIATTQFVVNQGYLKSSSASSTYATLDSPALIGTPTSTTAALGTNNTQIATTAFVSSGISVHSALNNGTHGVSGNIVGTTDSQTLSNKTLTSPSINSASITDGSLNGTVVNLGIVSGGDFNGIKLKFPLEKINIVSSSASGSINIDISTSSIWYYTLDSSANWTLNFRLDSVNTLDSVMSIGDSITVSFLAKQGTTAYYPSSFSIDGSSVVPEWQYGITPTSGNPSSIDAYYFTIIKTGSSTFNVLASQSPFS